MKKSSKILGSVALSAALVMGTAAPAFAATQGQTNDLNIGNTEGTDIESIAIDTTTGGDMEMVTKGNATKTTNEEGEEVVTPGASTVIKASTYTSQLSVTIPLVLPLKFDTVGGIGLAPNDDMYYIQNNSSTNITVTKADYAVIDTANWQLGENAFADSTETVPTPGSSKGIGDFYLKMAPTAQLLKVAPEGQGLKNFELKATTVDSTKHTEDGTAELNWAIQPDQKFGLHLEPSSSKLNKSTDESRLAAVTYTVRVGADEKLLSRAPGQSVGKDFDALVAAYKPGTTAPQIRVDGESKYLTKADAGSTLYTVISVKSKNDPEGFEENWKDELLTVTPVSGKKYSIVVQEFTPAAED